MNITPLVLFCSVLFSLVILANEDWSMQRGERRLIQIEHCGRKKSWRLLTFWIRVDSGGEIEEDPAGTTTTPEYRWGAEGRIFYIEIAASRRRIETLSPDTTRLPLLLLTVYIQLDRIMCVLFGRHAMMWHRARTHYYQLRALIIIPYPVI
jgi:hypothetical protein